MKRKRKRKEGCVTKDKRIKLKRRKKDRTMGSKVMPGELKS